jgi:hypothetical protein
MELDEALDRISELEREVEVQRRIQSGIDRSYHDAAKQLARFKGYSPAEIESRIKAISDAFDSKTKAMKLEYFIKTRCVENAIPYELVDGIHFDDEQAAEAHLARLSQVFEAKRLDERNQIFTSTQKPQAGNPQQPVASRSLSVVESMAQAAAGL